MIYYSKVDSTRVNKLLQRIVKVLTFGRSSVIDAHEVSPFGIDSNPVNQQNAVVAETIGNGKRVVIGYLNNHQETDVGGIRIFSTDDKGEEQTSIYLKPDGSIEMDEADDKAVRFNDLRLGLMDQDSQIQMELVKISAAISSLGGTYTPGTIQTDVNDAESQKIYLS